MTAPVRTGGVGSTAAAPRDATVVVASAGVLMTLVAFTTPLATLSDTAAGLGAGTGAQAWILSAMSLGCAVGLMPAGAIGDERGRRRTFVVGASLLAAASVLAGLASAPVVLVVARVVQGLGGAAVMACGLGLVGQAFPAGQARARATAAWGAALGGGVALGPILAAGLAALGGWRLPHLAIGAGALILGGLAQRLLAESRAEHPRPLDLAGGVLLGAGVAALLAGLVEGRSAWGTPATVALLAGAAVLLVGFVAVEHRRRHPMLDLGLLRRADFVGATVAAVAAGAGILSLSNVVPAVLERGLGTGAVLASVVLLAWSATSAVTAYAARWIPARMSPRVLLVCSLVGVAAGQLALIGVTSQSSAASLVPGLLLAGAANGVLNAALGRQAVASVPADRTGMGSGANNAARYIGSAVGITVVAILVGGAAPTPAGVVTGWNTAVVVTAAVSLVGALVVLVARDRSGSP